MKSAASRSASLPDVTMYEKPIPRSESGVAIDEAICPLCRTTARGPGTIGSYQPERGPTRDLGVARVDRVGAALEPELDDVPEDARDEAGIRRRADDRDRARLQQSVQSREEGAVPPDPSHRLRKIRVRVGIRVRPR